MSTNPLCSVLIPSYNNAQYLEQCLSSVFNQTYTNWEIIIVDDCSTDNSFAIYDKYQSNDRIHIFYNEENQGCGFTKKRCIDNANGEICMFLDSDDALIEDALEKHVKAHQANPHAAMVTARLYYCDENLNIIKEGHVLTLQENESYLSHGVYNPEVPSFKLSYYLKTPGLSTYRFGGDDQDLIYKLEEVGKLIVINEFTYKYRVRKNSISHSETNTITLFSNLTCQCNAFYRRKLTDEKLLEHCYSIVHYHIYGLGYQYAKKYYTKTYAYRLGKLLLTPIFWIKGLHKKTSTKQI